MFERDKGPPDASGSPYHERVPSVFALERIPFEWNISGIGEIVGALLGGEAAEDVAESVP
jgi:hypothetical protein